MNQEPCTAHYNYKYGLQIYFKFTSNGVSHEGRPAQEGAGFIKKLAGYGFIPAHPF